MELNCSPDTYSFDDIAVSADGTVWVAGGRYGGAKLMPLVRRFDGTRWEELPPPPLPGFILRSITLDARGLPWVFSGPAMVPVREGTPETDTTAAHWDGAKWTIHPLRGALIDSASAGTNVWALTDGSALQWNGRSWRATRMPINATAIGASSDGSAWAVGRKRSQIARWTGRRWVVVAAPEVRLPRLGGDAGFADVLVQGRDDVWLVGGIDSADTEHEEFWSKPWLARWNGRTWSSRVQPKRLEERGYTAIESDGRGGAWIVQGEGKILWHYDGAGARRAAVHSPCEEFGVGALLTLARRPGTTTVWAVGETSLCAATGGDVGRVTTGVWRSSGQ